MRPIPQIDRCCGLIETDTGPSPTLKPAGRHGEKPTIREVLSELHILLGKAMATMKEENAWEWPGAGRSRHGRQHDAHPRRRHLHPLNRKCFASGWCASSRNNWRRAQGPILH
jgi:hypothetical protein